MRFIRALSAPLILLLLLVGQTACTKPGPATPADATVSVMDLTSAAAMDRQDFEVAYVALQPAMAPDLFYLLSPGMRHRLASRFAVAAYQSAHFEEANKASRLATEQPGATALDWRSRLAAALMVRSGPDAAASVTYFSERPGSLTEGLPLWEAQDLEEVLGRAADPKASRLQLYTILVKGRWSPERPEMDGSTLWLHAAVAFLESGDQVQARRMLARVTEPTAVAEAGADRRFDGMSAGATNANDAAQRAVTAMRALAVVDANSGQPPLALSRALYTVGDDEGALEVIEQALQRVGGPCGCEPGAFEDARDVRMGLMARKATILLALGREDEAMGFLSAGAAQYTNLRLTQGRALVLAGRGREALTVLGDAPPTFVNVRGVAEYYRLQACALAQTGDKAGARAALAQIRATHASLSLEAFEALLCLDDKAGAAAEFVARLDDPFTRGPALLMAQDPRSTRSMRFQAALRERRGAVLEEATVKAALARYGRRQAVPVRFIGTWI